MYDLKKLIKIVFMFWEKVYFLWNIRYVMCLKKIYRICGDNENCLKLKV